MIEYHVRAFALGVLKHPGGEVCVAIVDYRVGAESNAMSAFFSASGGGQYLCACCFSKLNRGARNTASGSVNEYGFLGLQMANAE